MNFHLAVPALDLEESKQFYIKCGGKVGREYKTHVVLRFFNCQLVLHKAAPEDILPVKMYPRHFGVIFFSYQELNQVFTEIVMRKIEPFEKLFLRREGEFEEHMTFFITDPANNLIEFKAYKNLDAIFG